MLLACAITVFSLYLTLALQWDGPFRDLWEFVDDIERQFNGDWSLTYLLEAYGGAHRIFLPKLVFYADYAWFGGRNGLTIAVSLLCQCAYLAILLRVLRTQATFSTAERTLLASGFVLALFSTGQVNNFLYAMDVQWYMSNLFGLVALAALSQHPAATRWWLVLLAGTAAALCNFTGLMALPVAILVLLATGQWQRWPLLLALVTLCVLYVHHEKNEQQVVFSALRQSETLKTTLFIMLDTVMKMVPYILRYLASPLSREWPVAGGMLSLTGIAVLLWYWWQLWRGAALTRWQRLCLYIASYIAASAVFTAFGRIIYPNSAVAERYQTLVLPWLPSLFGLLWPDLRRHGWLAWAWLALFGAYLLPAQLTSARDMAILSHRVNLAHAAARAAVLEPPYINASLSHPLIKNNINSVKDNDAFLRANLLGYFRHLPAFALDARPSLPPGLPACAGHVVGELDANTGTWLLNGQLLADGKPLPDIVVLQDGNVRGHGVLLRPENHLGPLAWQAAAASRFRAFARSDRVDAQQPLQLLGLQHGQVRCSLAASLR